MTPDPGNQQWRPADRRRVEAAEPVEHDRDRALERG